MLRQFILIMLTSQLLACASISKNECLLGDWYSLGVNDGKAGELSSKFREYQKDCADHGVTPDFKTYQQGHSQGLVFFCDFPHGEAWGRAGKDYNTACTGPMEPAFRSGFQQGQRWYKAKKVVDDIALAINDLQNRNLTLREDIYAINQRIAVEQNASARAALLNQADRLRYQMEGYNQEIGRLQIRMAQAEANFAPLNR
jgi:hypothetical protein